ncbi:MAG: hypothetical protein V3U06_09840, partial [Candidatus Binatia bacterium]
LNNIASLGLQEKINYVWVRVRQRIRGIVSNTMPQKAKMLVCKFYLRFRHRVPTNLRNFYYLQANGQAVGEYVPQDYPGSLVLLRCKGNSDNGRLDWGEFVANKFERHDLPGKHLDAMGGPHAQIWSKILRDCLEKAQKTMSGKQN